MVLKIGKIEIPKWVIFAFVAVLIMTAIYIPFASEDPDGLEKTLEEEGVPEPGEVWNAPFDFGGSFLSDFAGVLLGMILCFVVAYIFYVTPKKKAEGVGASQ